MSVLVWLMGIILFYSLMAEFDEVLRSVATQKLKGKITSSECLRLRDLLYELKKIQRQHNTL